LNADELDAQNFYVAVTRIEGSGHLFKIADSQTRVRLE
jgi:hypothetical protein